MARRSSAARAADDNELDVDFSERNGFLTGKSAAIADWHFRKLQNEGDFQRLIWRLQAKKYWANKPAERKAMIRAYRERWRKLNMDRANASSRKSKAKRRADPSTWRAELDSKKTARAIERQARRAETVYTCAVCGSRWSPIGRIPARPPKYCDQPCRARANYVRGKAARKPWALRTREHRRDRRPMPHVGTGQVPK